ncbi:response regulator transcription factor [Vagococcus sp. BWB3-3]|uniref:Response regulator transcription factor n=1 Tax=Vagococcus allomyrinae TaxID=2794353 RepID=A0A940PAI1_9ENTE|nr:response regulator transcription factor [Vagococcus allomyrinae]MBP1042616.1 response regulator transcription factor [Vagococcus allomyrinae]
MPYKLLVIEDDKNFQHLIVSFLESENYEVTAVDDGLEGVMAFEATPFDLVIVDVMMPLLDGYGVSKMIRKKSKVPIIMLTALSEEKSQIEGFDSGIDDYITKPLSFTVFLQRIKALLVRSYGEETTNVLRFKEIEVFLDEHRVFVGATEVSLTHKEYLILTELMSRPNQVFTREQLINKVWGYDHIGNLKIINQHIKNLRKKLGGDFIQSVKNVGYRLDD